MISWVSCWRTQTGLRLAAKLLSRVYLLEWHRVLHKSNFTSYFNMSGYSKVTTGYRSLLLPTGGRQMRRLWSAILTLKGEWWVCGEGGGEGTTPQFQPFPTFSSRKLRNCWKTSLSETIGCRHILVIQACSLSIRILINSSSKRPIIQ